MTSVTITQLIIHRLGMYNYLVVVCTHINTDTLTIHSIMGKVCLYLSSFTHTTLRYIYNSIYNISHCCQDLNTTPTLSYIQILETLKSALCRLESISASKPNLYRLQARLMFWRPFLQCRFVVQWIQFHRTSPPVVFSLAF